MLSLRTARWYPPGVPLGDLERSFLLADGTSAVPFLTGATGLLAPSYTLNWSQVAGQRTMTLDSAVEKPDAVTLTILVEGDTHAELRRKRSELINAMAPTRGAGMLELSADLYTDPGEVRWCSAVVVDGLRGEESLGNSGPTFWKPTIKFQPTDLWYSTEPVVATWTGLAGVPVFPWRIDPFRLAAGGVAAVTQLDLQGDPATVSWPTYTLSGPFTRARFTNDRTGQSWEVSRDREFVNEPLIVTTQAGLPVRTLDGQSRYSWLTFQSDLFALGFNAWNEPDTVSVDADGTSAATLFQLSVVPAWLTAP